MESKPDARQFLRTGLIAVSLGGAGWCLWAQTQSSNENVDPRVTLHGDTSGEPVADRSSRSRRPLEAPRPGAAVDPLAEQRQLLQGRWQQENTGIRWLEIRPDGDASMRIDPDWVAAAIIGEKLIVQIEWTLEDDHLLFRSVSGSPSAAFKTVTSLYGKEQNRKLIELTDQRFVLLDGEDGSQSIWTRVPEGQMFPAMK